MLQIDFINVGYGDAILLREDGLFSMLIDCGTPDTGTDDPASPRVTTPDFLRIAGVSRLDLMIVTHLHIDHVGTIDRLARQTEIAALWTPYLPAPVLWQADEARLAPLQRGMKEFLSALTVLGERGCAMRAIDRPEAVRLTDALTLGIDFAHPYLIARQRAALDGALSGRPDPRELTLYRRYMNATCPLLTLAYHGKRIVLPGDAYGHLWDTHALSPCYLLKASHHGCADSVTDALLQKLTPEIIVVPVSSDREDDRPNRAAVACMQRHAGSVRFTDAIALPGVSEPPHAALTFVLE